jgi:hypothetical protein
MLTSFVGVVFAFLLGGSGAVVALQPDVQVQQLESVDQTPADQTLPPADGFFQQYGCRTITCPWFTQTCSCTTCCPGGICTTTCTPMGCSC